MGNPKKPTKENELNELFNQNSSNESFAKIVGKARRKTIFRNLVISALVLILLTVAAGIAWLSIMRWHEASAMQDIELFNRITNPNIEVAGMQHEGNGLFEGILRFERYKVIEGIPVDWSEETMTYSIFGGVSRFSGDHSHIGVEDEATSETKYYDRETKQRVLSFYHPAVEYGQSANAFNELERFSSGTVAEVSLSFDQAYTPAEVRQSMPEGVTLKWQWVDTYSSEDIEWLKTLAGDLEGESRDNSNNSAELANEVYGFEEIEDILGEEDPLKSEDVFIRDIQAGLNQEDGKYIGEYTRISNLLKGEAPRLTAENVQVIGAVVTGDVEALMSLQELPMIRATALGVTAHPYP